MVGCMLIDRKWDSDFFGRNIYDLTSFENIENSIVNCQGGLITTKISSVDKSKKNHLLKEGFIHCETEDVYSKLIEHNLNSDGCLIKAEKPDLFYLYQAASNLYQYSRFKAPWFSIKERESFYQKWILNAVNGAFDDLCLMLKGEDRARGFITGRRLENDCYIGLIGVNPNDQRIGLGKQILHEYESYVYSQFGETRIKVSTQGRNVNAKNMYKNSKYELVETNYWFYKHV